MSYSDTNIANRQIVNLNADLAVAANISQSIGLNLRFVPDAVIVRQIVYSSSAGEADQTTLQIYFDLALDQIIGSFPLSYSTSQPGTTFLIRPNFRNVTFQIQEVPTSGTGNGALYVADADSGKLSVILEFVRYKR